MPSEKYINSLPAYPQTRGDVDTVGMGGTRFEIGADSALTIDSGYDNTLLLELPSTIINKSFGREEDYIELHIFNNANQLIYFMIIKFKSNVNILVILPVKSVIYH